MLYSHFIIALRTLRKTKIYTAINLIGLTAGIAAVLLIFRMVKYELSFNKNFQNYDRIGRVVSVEKNPEQGENYSVCIPIPAMDEMQQSIGQFERLSRIYELWASVIIPNPAGGAPLKKIRMETAQTALFVDSNFVKIFDFQWLAGDPNTALSEPNAIVLTKTMAEKCFDQALSAMGNTVLLDNLVPVKVNGIIEDLPDNCDFSFPYLVSYPTVKANADYFFYQEEWGSCSSNNQVYVLLKDPDQLSPANAVLSKVGEKEYTNEETGNRGRVHVLQPLKDLHYSENYQHSGNHRTSRTRLRILSGIGALILIMACFNFINLATAQASLRAKEVGVRKTMGGRREQLTLQFMSETALIVLGAVVLGTGIAYLCLPLLRFISDVPVDWPFFKEPVLWLLVMAIALVVTVLAGLYPALSLAGYQPVKALKNEVVGQGFTGAAVRKSLVVLQFAIAQALIIGAAITIMQLDYIRTCDLGFQPDLVYTFGFNNDSASIARQEVLRNKLQQVPGVLSVSLSSDFPLSGNHWVSNFRFGAHAQDEPYGIHQKFCDPSFQETYGIKLLAGQWLAPSDTMREAVVNFTLLKKLGIADPQEVIGENIRVGGRRVLRIVGVADDFHTGPLQHAHVPLLLSTRKEYYWNVGVKMRPDNLQANIAEIKKIYDVVFPEQIMAGRFLDEDIARFYEDDRRLSAACRGFGLLAILISCLGLFGLATHSAAQRIKEIGIRKVLGASVGNLVGLLAKDFVKLVLIGLALAVPTIGYVMQKWLENFAFHIDIGWQVFLLSGLAAIAVALISVGFQSMRAALANPIDSLKNE